MLTNLNESATRKASENCSENDTVTVCGLVRGANIQTLITDHARLRKVTRINDQKQLQGELRK